MAKPNAVGFTGYDTIAGPNSRQCKGYGQNRNTIVNQAGKTSLQMTGNTGSMQLSAYSDEVSYTASWKKFGTAQIRKIILAAPIKKTVSSISVMLDGAEQSIEKSSQDGNTITIELKSVSEVEAGSALTVSYGLYKQ